MRWLLGIGTIVTILAIVNSQELLKNPDMEEAFNGQENWWCNNCQLEHSTDSYSGSYSAKVTNRAANWAGLSQYVNLQANKKYIFSARVKYLNQLSGYQWHQFDLMFFIEYSDGSNEYKWFGRLPHMELAHGWQLHGADVVLGSKAISRVRFYFQVNEAGVNYLVDTTSFTEIQDNPNWLDEANARIEQIRKADITFDVSISPIYNPSDIQLDISLTRHAVPFGAAINSDFIVGQDTTSSKYQQFFYNNFEIAVLENALKWRLMEPIKDQINYDRPERAIDALRQNGIPVRGHCVYWEVDKNVPEWLKSTSGDQLRQEISRRAQYVVQRFNGKLVHWDVNNEDLHGTFFKRQTGDTNIINTMFQEVRQHDPDVKLFLNEYAVVQTGTTTSAYVNQANRLQAAGVPIYGVGVQSHISGYVDPAVLQARLDVIAQAGLPMWVTELDYPNTDVNARADGYEIALRLYYSNPNIEGILIWGFWDGAHWKPDAALVNGNDFTINEAGRRWQQLVRGEWHTSATLQPSSSSEEIQIRGFQGSYNINIKHQGNIIKTASFDVGNGVQSIRVPVNV